MLNIYIATSWKNQVEAVTLANILREEGFAVDCFCDPSTGRFVFSYADLPVEARLYDHIDIFTSAIPGSVKAFNEDRKWLEWCDVCIMLLPCGKSAHIEAGFAAGRGKTLIIYGDGVPGQFEVMYGFAECMYRSDEWDIMIERLATLATQKDHEERGISGTI